jgi:hypothetical protein
MEVCIFLPIGARNCGAWLTIGTELFLDDGNKCLYQAELEERGNQASRTERGSAPSRLSEWLFSLVVGKPASRRALISRIGG